MTLKYTAFMCHLPATFNTEEEFKYLEETLNEYNIGGYVIALETEPYIHFHFLVETDEQTYTNFRKRVFIDRYKLRGQAKEGKPRQYGKVKDIKDLEKMLAYTVKDQDIRSNLDDETISNAIDKSFKKEKPKLLKEKMLYYVEKQMIESTVNEKTIKLAIIDFCINEHIDIRKSIVDTYHLYFRQYTKNKKAKYDRLDFYEKLYIDLY